MNFYKIVPSQEILDQHFIRPGEDFGLVKFRSIYNKTFNTLLFQSTIRFYKRQTYKHLTNNKK